MSTADKLAYLNDTKIAIKQSIINKGVTVTDSDTFRSYADKIGQIEAGSGGTGGEVIEAIIDASALPIEKDKKVVVADVQATGQGAGAIMPFDIVPYDTTNGTVSDLLQLRGEYSLHVNVNNASRHIGYKKVGDRWEGKYFTNTITGGIPNPNDAFNLLYDSTNYRYFCGSNGKYWNPIKEQEETITFDEPLTTSLIANVTTRYFLTFDSKYLWAVHLNITSTNQSAANKGLICLYEITIDVATGEVFAHKKTEELEIEMLAGAYQQCVCSLNHYGIVVYTNNNGSQLTYVQYNETENTLTGKTGVSFWGSGSSFTLTAFTKDWVMLRYSNSHRVYWGDIFAAVLQGWNFGTGTNGYHSARFGNTLYPLDIYYDGVGSASMTFIKMPVDKEQPVPDDFIFNTVTCYSSDAGPYMIDEENCIVGSTYSQDNTQSLRSYNIPNNQRTESDPGRVPAMLLDDGTGYFYKNDKDITSGTSLEAILPVTGSYNNGTVLHTITRSSQPYPYQMIQPQGFYSPNAGSFFRFGTLPMRYLNSGNCFIFQTYYYNTSSVGGIQRGWFFRRVDEDPIMLEWLSHRSLVVGQNKAYITPRKISSTQHPLTVIDADGVRDYTPINAENAPGVMFDFEGKLYCYQYRNNATNYGGYGCYEIMLNDEDMTATYTQFDDGSVYSPMASYITQDSMSSNPYPLSTYSSHYNQPVLTKDGKYYVGLAGNHTTHYAKIEKHESGYPILNVYELPQQLKDLLYEQEILYFEAYYPSGFGIQLANGTFLLCEYEQGLDVDLTITAYTPAHSYTPSIDNQCLMHFTANKHYWYFSAGTYWSAGQGSVTGYAGCGRREDLPSTYQKRVYSLKHDWHPADHVTGYLTGESYTDENGKLIAEVEVLRK